MNGIAKPRTLHRRKLGRFRHNPRIEVARASNCSGAKENFAELMRLAGMAHGPYIMLCGQDDVWRTNKIERVLGEMHRLELAVSPSTPLLVHSDLEVANAGCNRTSGS